MKILSINCGSSSLKFQMYEMPKEKVLISGVFERIGSENSFYTLKLNGEKIKKETPILEHSKAVDILIKELFNYDIVESLDEIKGVGHRVVHGGEKYSKSVLIDDDVMNTIEELIPLAPLHNPANLMGIKAFEKDIPNAKQVAVFDTAFPESMPEESYMFTAPYEWYTKYGLRHYGFHGISHNYVVDYMKKELNKENINMINCHLGNGSTAACIKDGVCFDTTLGFSTNSGLMMGTRSGDIDPYIIPYIMKQSGMTFEEVLDNLNKKSGFLGVSGVSSDSRDIEDGIKEGNERCILAQKLFVNRVVSYIAKFYLELKHVDAITFSGGIGENSIMTRTQILEGLEPLGVVLDSDANDVRGEFRLITKEGSKIPCYIVPTDEEVMIARDTYKYSK